MLHELRIARILNQPGGAVSRKFTPDAEGVRKACIGQAEKILDFMPGSEFVAEVKEVTGPRGGQYFVIATRSDHGPTEKNHGFRGKHQNLQEYMTEKAEREGENSWLWRGLREVFPTARRDRTRINI